MIPADMRRFLCAALFLSGAAAILFENLWFRGAHLALGNGVWAQSLVLASFMAGLSAGAALAARYEARVARPLRAYVGLELVVAVLGLVLVAALPRASTWLAPLLGPLSGSPLLLNGARLAAAFAALVVPTTAMGMTLPVLTRALARSGTFGDNLGALYGWNTLGAVAGALCVEAVLVPALGVRGSGLLASALGLGAAFVAFLVLRREGSGPPPSTGKLEAADAPAAHATPLRKDVLRLLAVAALAGGVLLALEVVWFRFLAQYTDGTALSFAMLLATVLLGIALGGLAASAWLRRAAETPIAGLVLAGAGLAVVLSYAGFARWLEVLLDPSRDPRGRALLGAAWLTLPTSFLSGFLFPLLGAGVERRLGTAQRSAGWLLSVNTGGALAGALLGGFVLLPGLGMERSFFVLAAAYVVAVLLLPGAERWPLAGPGRLAGFGLMALGLTAVALFPFGLMARLYVRAPLVRFGESEVLEVREGLTETAVLLEHRVRGRRHSLRLVTNGFSMTAASWNARRYMGLYADLPLALHERPRSALLICYGIGVTARALVESPDLERIDVVDVAPEVIALAEAGSRGAGANPLRDPRVRVRIEDGRAFLALSGERYDLITAEPPPPTNAGIASLYTREHFELVRSRLAEGGFATYWLPVHTLDDLAAPAVIQAFCSVFADCTLWRGADLDWMLVGTRGRTVPVDAARVRAHWTGTRGAALREVGVDGPLEMAALFLADSARLREFAAGVPPLDDDRPSRIGKAAATLPTAFAYRVLFGPEQAGAFASSKDVAALWPEELRSAAPAAFPQQALQDRLLVARLGGKPPEEAWLHEAYVSSSARLPVLLWFGSNPDLQRIAREAEAAGEADEWVHGQLAIAALAARRPAEAAALARRSLPSAGPSGAFLLTYALVLDGRLAEARAVLSGVAPRSAEYLKTTFPALAAP